MSPKSEDWANFATYISGTVGVAAVVATLMAFVKTLGQQQALIDSQNVMLEKQELQLKLAQQQVDGEERRRQVELAYNCAVNIIPSVIDELNKHMEMSVEDYLKNYRLEKYFPNVASVRTPVKHFIEIDIARNWLKGLDEGDQRIICMGILSTPFKLGRLVSDCLYVASELEDYFRAKIGYDNWQAIRCAMLFNKNTPGTDFDKHRVSLKIFLGEKNGSPEQYWESIGDKMFVR